MESKNFIIAEIGCNHKGDMDIAKEMIKVAAQFCYVDAVKFQKRNNNELLTKEEYNTPHPVPYNAYGKTYGEHREALEFTVEQHKELMQCCKEWGIEYSTSVWDLTSAKEIVDLQPGFIKIPSACNLNFEMLSYIAENFQGEIHISFGMTTHKEELAIIELFAEKNRNKDLIIYACTSGYPVEPQDVCLLEIKRLRECYQHLVKEIGFSGHHNGISIDMAALTLGARYFERHFTLNRTWKGTDHAASLEPDGMRRLVRDLQNVNLTLEYKKEEILDVEKVQRAKLKYENGK